MDKETNKDFTVCYHRLGLHYQASWEEIRQAYRRAMRRWHPDRHAQARGRQREAEEKTKEIASAYRRLAQYYRQHGRPPPYGFTPETIRPVADPTVRTRGARTASKLHDSEPSVSPNPSPVSARRSGQFWFALGLAFVLGLFVFGHVSRQPPAPDTEETVSSASTLTVTVAPEPQRFFTIGSSPQEVYAAQGIPDRMEKDVWHYGKARVYFVDGKVDRWETTPDTLLRANLSVGAASLAQAPFFTLGSTKEYVRAIQGTPTRETETLWEYGTSKVYFDENGQVSGWEESPFFALRVRR